MELSRFREIKEKIKEIVNIQKAIENGDTIESSMTQLEKEYNIIVNEIQNSDMSDIPFEEFEGFPILEFDFTKTGANIDFDLIDLSLSDDKLRFQGCNIRNLDLSKIDINLLDDKSFDSDVIEANPEYFAPQKITDSAARDRYYQRNLNLSDLQKYDLKDVDPSRTKFVLRDLIREIGMNKIFDLDGEIVDLVDSGFEFNVSSNNLTQDSSVEEIEAVLRDTVRDQLKSRSVYYESLEQSSYVRENFPEYLVEFPEGQEELRKKFLEKELTIEDISENLEIFKGKKFIDRFGFKLYAHDITEEKIIYLMEQLPNIVEIVKENISDFGYAVGAIDLEKV